MERTVNDIYIKAGTLMGFNKQWEAVRRKIERLVMKEFKYSWRDEMTDEMYEEFLGKGEAKKGGGDEQRLFSI